MIFNTSSRVAIMSYSHHITLLDFDGVLYNNKVTNAIVSKKAAQYVRNVLRVKDRNDDFYDKMNKYLYKTYGHTVTGLHKIGYKVNINEFNEYVYSDLPYDELSMKEKLNLPDNTYIFSNAPTEYCNKIANTKLPNIRDIIPTYYDIFFLKPHKRIYSQIEEVFHDCSITFVDDSLINLNPVLHKHRWTPILFTQDVSYECLYNIGALYVMNNPMLYAKSNLVD